MYYFITARQCPLLLFFFWGVEGVVFLGGGFWGGLSLFFLFFLVVHKALVTLLSCISVIKFKFSLFTLTKHSDTRGQYTIKIEHSIQFDLAKTESIR